MGLSIIVLGAWGIIEWWDDFGEMLRGSVPLLLVLVGLAAIGAGFQKTTNEAESEDMVEPDADLFPHAEEGASAGPEVSTWKSL